MSAADSVGPHALPDSDARPAALAPRDRDEPPDVVRRRRLRRHALRLGIVTVFAGAAACALVGKGGLVEARALRREVGVLRAEVEARRSTVEALRGEVDRLEHDPYALERVAREQLGLVRPGEIDFLLPRGEAAAP